MTGTIKRLVRDKGFGFIAVTGGRDEYFFHRSGVEDTQFEDLTEGMAVSFETEPSSKGPRAVRVRVGN